jgi:hypothetical protein
MTAQWLRSFVHILARPPPAQIESIEEAHQYRPRLCLGFLFVGKNRPKVKRFPLTNSKRLL